EIAGRVARLPHPARRHGGQIRRPSFGHGVARHVVTQRVQRDEKSVMRPDQTSRVEHRLNPLSYKLRLFRRSEERKQKRRKGECGKKALPLSPFLPFLLRLLLLRDCKTPRSRPVEFHARRGAVYHPFSSQPQLIVM